MKALVTRVVLVLVILNAEQPLALAATPWCLKGTTMQGFNTRFPGNKGPDITVRVDLGQSIQNAIDTVTDLNGDGYILIGSVNGNGSPYGSTNQRIIIDRTYPLPFGLFGCSLTLRDPRPADGLPTAHITLAASAPDLFVMDLHASGSEVAGWLVEGNGRYLRNAYAERNAIGYWIVGDNNTLGNSAIEENTGVGILISGNGNTISNNSVVANASHGIDSVGDNNQFVKNTIGDRAEGNEGDGMRVSGAGNLVQENKVHANNGDGIVVTGGNPGRPNIIRKNTVGDKNKGNGGNGIVISADLGNGTPNPLELEANTVKANGLNGIVIGHGSIGHELKGNTSGGDLSLDNSDCEFLVAAGNLNATGNKANRTVIAGKDGEPFPTNCVGTP